MAEKGASKKRKIQLPMVGCGIHVGPEWYHFWPLCLEEQNYMGVELF